MSIGSIPVVLGAAAGGLVALALREALLSAPSVAAWVASSLEPLGRAGREGYVPSAAERRRLALLGSLALLGAALLLGGPVVGFLAAAAGPALAASILARRRQRYRRAVERALPDVAHALADSLAAGRSLRGALASSVSSLDGPPAAELARVGADLDLGAPTGTAVEAFRGRLRSERVDAFCAVLLSQRLAGGDLAGLLRRFADSSAARDRAADDARTATAQARFTGLLVVAMPAGAALFAELFAPGFFANLLAKPTAASLLLLAGGLQLAGFVAIRRISRIGW